MAIDGPSGSGKTMTALRFAFALGSRVLVIDTEHRSSELYAGESPDGVPFDFDVLTPETHDPDEYSVCLREAAEAGYDAVIIDSLSHAWIGVDGALDQVDRKASADPKGNSFSAWRDVTPKQRRLVEAIINSPIHVIATMRTKTEYVVEPNRYGKMAPRKVGLAPIQRDGMEYEFDIYVSLDIEHNLTVNKSRCRAVPMGEQFPLPGAAFLLPVVRWLAGESVEVVLQPPTQQDTDDQVQDDHQAETRAAAGESEPAMDEQAASAVGYATGDQIDEIDAEILRIGWTDEVLARNLMKQFRVRVTRELTQEQASRTIEGLKKVKQKKERT